jgi:hypothetical protein
MPMNIYENIRNIKPTGPLAKDIPSNKFVIHTGRMFLSKSVANPKVQTTINDPFRFNFSSSNLSMSSVYINIFGIALMNNEHRDCRSMSLF